MDTLKNVLTKKTYGSRNTGSKADNVGTWKGDPTVAPPVRKTPPPTFTVPPPPESPPPSNPASASSTPPRSVSPTAYEKLRNRRTDVSRFITAPSPSNERGWIGTHKVIPKSGRRKTRKHKRKTHRRRR
jgi:hypothetical protein